MNRFQAFALFGMFSMLAGCTQPSPSTTPESSWRQWEEKAIPEAFLPEHSPDTSIQIAADDAFPKVRTGENSTDACAESLRKFNIKSQDSVGDDQACVDKIDRRTKEIERQQLADALKRDDEARAQRAKELADQAAAAEQAKAQKQQEFEQAVADIRAGKRQAQTAQEAAAAIGAEDGTRYASAPLLQPDGHDYFISGYISGTGMTPTAFMAQVSGSDGQPVSMDPRYFAVGVPDDVEPSLARAHVGSLIRMVGAYVSNSTYTTVSGMNRGLPVFRAVFIEVVN